MPFFLKVPFYNNGLDERADAYNWPGATILSTYLSIFTKSLVSTYLKVLSKLSVLSTYLSTFSILITHFIPDIFAEFPIFHITTMSEDARMKT